MERVLEPELMTDPEQARAYAEADFEALDDAFMDAFVARFPRLPPGPLVDLGCGPGNIALRLAARHPQRPIVAVDGAPVMLELARAATPPGSKLSYLEAHLPSDALPSRSFAAILSNSLLHHLPDPAVLWKAVHRLGVPGAAVFVGDLRRPGSTREVDRLVALHAATAPPLLRRDFRASLHAAFRPAEVSQQLAAAGLALTVTALGDRHLRVHGWLPVEQRQA